MADAAGRMVETLRHRGPDGTGVWADLGVGLAHRRLSIIDIGGGAQPMVSPRTGSVIVFNGEIYNYLELKAGLEAKGYSLATNSDTEVLLALFDEAGEKCLDQLVGMYAFAIWQPKARRLFLARDRLGKKPLYIAHTNGFFAFGSEIKALLALPAVRNATRLNPQALSDFLSFGFVLSPKTFYSAVSSLPAGNAAQFDMDENRWHQWDYWQPERFFTAPRFPDSRQTIDQFSELFDDAVRLRLRADVPLGAFLSGGLDSTAVVESVVRQSPRPPQAFTVGFTDPGFDESAAAAQVAAYLGASFTRLEQPTPDESWLSRMIEATDQPFADTSLLPSYTLCRAAHSQVIVALSGDGADEFLAGYPTYRADALFRLFRLVPSSIRSGLRHAADAWVRPRYGKVGWDFKLKQFLRAEGYSRERAHASWRLYFSESEKAHLLSRDLLDLIGDYDPVTEMASHFRHVSNASFLDASSYVDMKTWLVDDILVKVDRMSMASSLEVRSPFLDHRLVEMMAQMDSRTKMRFGTQKAALRRHLSGRVPLQVLSLPKKGFNAPTRNVALTRMPMDVAPSLFSAKFVLDPEAQDISYKGFALAILDCWLRSEKGLRSL